MTFKGQLEVIVYRCHYSSDRLDILSETGKLCYTYYQTKIAKITLAMIVSRIQSIE